MWFVFIIKWKTRNIYSDVIFMEHSYISYIYLLTISQKLHMYSWTSRWFPNLFILWCLLTKGLIKAPKAHYNKTILYINNSSARVIEVLYSWWLMWKFRMLVAVKLYILKCVYEITKSLIVTHLYTYYFI